MDKLAAVKVVKGPTSVASRDVASPNGLTGAVGRIKGNTLTLYDERYSGVLSGINWDVDGCAPRAFKMPLAAYVWTQVAKRELPEGHVVGTVSRRAFDVRLANLELVAGKQAFRASDGDWLLPAEVDATRLGMRFLPKGVTVNSTKVMISQAGRLKPGEHGANDKGLWSRSISHGRLNVEPLVLEAIGVLEKAHGRDAFAATNAAYQQLQAEYSDAVAALLGSRIMDGTGGLSPLI